MDAFSLRVITPYATLATVDQPDMVSCPGAEGDLGILKNHMPLITTVRQGFIRATKDAQTVLSVPVSQGQRGSIFVTPLDVCVMLQDFCPLSHNMDGLHGIAAHVLTVNSAQFGLYKIDTEALALLVGAVQERARAAMTAHPVALITRRWIESLPEVAAKVA